MLFTSTLGTLTVSIYNIVIFSVIWFTSLLLTERNWNTLFFINIWIPFHKRFWYVSLGLVVNYERFTFLVLICAWRFLPEAHGVLVFICNTRYIETLFWIIHIYYAFCRKCIKLKYNCDVPCFRMCVACPKLFEGLD